MIDVCYYDLSLDKQNSCLIAVKNKSSYIPKKGEIIKISLPYCEHITYIDDYKMGESVKFIVDVVEYNLDSNEIDDIEEKNTEMVCVYITRLTEYLKRKVLVEKII